MENFERPRGPEKQKEHIDEERLKTIAHFWLILLRKKGIAPEEIFRGEKKWPDIEEYTNNDVEDIFRANPEENKKFWERFKKDWQHIRKCGDCDQDFEKILWDQFR